MSTTLVAVAVASTVGAGILTAGRSIQSELDILATFDASVSRTIDVSVADGPGIDESEIVALARASTIEWAVGLGPAFDVRNPAAGAQTAMPARALVGDLPPGLLTIDGGAPAAGQALVGSNARAMLGLPYGVGAVLSDGGDDVPVVGTVTAIGPLAGLNDGVLVRPTDGSAPAARRVLVQAVGRDNLQDVRDLVVRQLSDSGSRRVDVTSDEAIAALRSAVAGELRKGSQAVLASVSAGGALVVAAVVLASAQSRRRDLGRRRALGASKGMVVALLMAQTAVAAVGGALAAVGVGIAASPWLRVDYAVTVAVAVLTAVTAVLASAPPAMLAAARDPVRVLRTP